MAVDLILYAVVAAGLVVWLRNILGTRHGDERQRPNPFTPAADQAETQAAPIHSLPGIEQADDILAVGPNVRIRDRGVEETIIRITRLDRDFNLGTFMQAAQDAFVMVVEAFAAGDRATLKMLLGPDVLRAFEQAVDAREKSGETVSTEIHAIRQAELLDVSLNGTVAAMTVRFVADETCVVRDGEGNILSGNPERVTEMIDVWVLSRDLRGRDPVWYVIETRDDVPEEGTPLPDTSL